MLGGLFAFGFDYGCFAGVWVGCCLGIGLIVLACSLLLCVTV